MNVSFVLFSYIILLKSNKVNGKEKELRRKIGTLFGNFV